MPSGGHTPEPDDTAMRSFDRSVPMALLRAREASMRAFRPILASHDLTEQQWRVLRALSATPHGLQVGDIADVTLLLGPSLSRILVRLESDGLVERSRVAHDARRSHISLTRAGRDLVKRVAPLSEAAHRAIEEGFGRERLQELVVLLDELTSASTGLDQIREEAS